MNKSNELSARIALADTAPNGALRDRIRQVAGTAYAGFRSLARAAYARHLERQRQDVAFDAVRHLDDHLLRDIGFEREACYQPEENYDVYRC